MQFVTLFPVHNPSKRAHPQNEICLTQKDTNFRNTMFLHYLRPEKCQKSNPERHEFRQHQNSLLPEARETPKTLPRKTRISATPKFFATLSQGIAKTNREIHKFHTKLHSLTPARMPRKVFSFPEFRTSL